MNHSAMQQIMDARSRASVANIKALLNDLRSRGYSNEAILQAVGLSKGAVRMVLCPTGLSCPDDASISVRLGPVERTLYTFFVSHPEGIAAKDLWSHYDEMRIKNIPTYNVILWDINHDQIEFYDIMPYLIDCWKDEKKRRHKIWDYEHKFSKDNTRMPETFDEFKDFIEKNCQYRFWSRCEYEIIVCGWPKGKNETKIDAYDQIMQNIDIVTGMFINHVTQNSRNHKLKTK